MKRRADLIPNLVETVKGFAKQEQTVFGDIANARSRLLNASSPGDKIDANNQLSGAIGRLLVLQEQYPQLKSNENFLRLQDELGGTENRIAISRRDYNEAIEEEAYSTGAAALVPYAALKKFISEGKSSREIAKHFGVSRALVEFRIKISRLWDAYKRLHQQVTEQFDDDFDSAFGKEFARAYEQASRKDR